VVATTWEDVLSMIRAADAVTKDVHLPPPREPEWSCKTEAITTACRPRYYFPMCPRKPAKRLGQ
jgi:hypothetical protein